MMSRLQSEPTLAQSRELMPPLAPTTRQIRRQHMLRPPWTTKEHRR
jgi:hypothetical protein